MTDNRNTLRNETRFINNAQGGAGMNRLPGKVTISHPWTNGWETIILYPNIGFSGWNIEADWDTLVHFKQFCDHWACNNVRDLSWTFEWENMNE